MITVNIASIPSREKELINTIDSLIDQVDKINVCLNNYTKNPYIHPKVNVSFEDNTYGDFGKFVFECDGYVLTCDDDIIYPETYAKDMVEAIDKYGIVTHHGRGFDSFPISSYYHSATHRVYCLGDNERDVPVQFGGTGVMGYHTKIMNPSVKIFKRKNMADIWISLYVHSLGFKIIALKHPSDYFKYQQVENTIWDEKHLKDEYETNIVNEYFLLK